jgi:2-polyprenyl-3-methyl-5-hydroxy-6-metoxy-1,4-benzoquinol methylase
LAVREKGASSKSSHSRSRTTTKPAHVEEVNWYDHPEWYECGFLKDTPREGRFLVEAFKKYVPFPVTRILETGCGSGRLVREMARRGYRTTGLDLNTTALAYCRKKLDESGLDAELVQGNMVDFDFQEPFDAAFNAINTFRHLETEATALKHLKCVARHLKPGGIFILSLHLVPKGGELWGTERWGTRLPELSVSYSLTVTEVDLKKRMETLKITMNVKEAGNQYRLQDQIRLRLYNVDQLKELLAKAKQLRLVGVHDFWFNIRERRRLSHSTCDTVLILQRV